MAERATILSGLAEHKRDFVQAMLNLLATLPEEQHGNILQDLANWHSAESAGKPYEVGILTAVAIRIVMQHIYQGFPLVLPAEVMAVYLNEGKRLETPLFECERCGYGVPRRFTSCPLCGGRTGLGAYGIRRSRFAVCN